MQAVFPVFAEESSFKSARGTCILPFLNDVAHTDLDAVRPAGAPALVDHESTAFESPGPRAWTSSARRVLQCHTLSDQVHAKMHSVLVVRAHPNHAVSV